MLITATMVTAMREVSMFSNGNSFAPEQCEDPKARLGFFYHVAGGPKMALR